MDALEQAGFDLDDVVSAFQVLVTFIVGHTMSEHAASTHGSSAYDELDPAAFPSLTRAAAIMGDHCIDDEFEFGLDALLRGLQEKWRRGSSKKPGHDS